MNKKIIASVLAVAFTFSMVVGSAGAVTVEELQAQITALLAQITTLQAQIAGTGTGAAAVCFNTDLQKGMTSNDVMNLQIKLGVTPTSGYFGSITFAAVKTFQTAHGIINTGYVGPLTRAALNTLYCTPVVPTTTTTVPPAGTTTTTILAGGAGSVEDYELVSSLSNEEVGEAQNDVKVAGLEIEVDEGSDLRFTAVQLTFDEGVANPANRDFDKYADEVSVWLGSNELARVDADRFNDDNNWIKTVTLSGSNVIAAGAIDTLYVKVSGINNLDSEDDGETWDVQFTAIRYMDAQGATISEDPGLDARTFSFETYATAADVELVVSSGADSINEAHVIDIDDNDETDEESIFAFDVEVEGDSGLYLDEVQVELVVANGAGDDLDEIASALYLFMDGEVVGQENVPADGVIEVTFDDLDLDLEAGETYEFIVKADLLSIADGVVAGDTIVGSINDGNTDDWDVEDEEGEDLEDNDKTGTATGEAHALYDAGIEVELVSVSKQRTFTADEAAETDQGTYAIVFKVTAFGDDMYIDNDVEEDNGADVAGQGVVFDTVDSQDGPVVSSAILDVADTETLDDPAPGENWIEEDDDRTFTLTVVLTGDAAADGSYEVILESVNWIDATTAEAAGGVIDADFTNYYKFNLGAFRTGALFLNDM